MVHVLIDENIDQIVERILRYVCEIIYHYIHIFVYSRLSGFTPYDWLIHDVGADSAAASNNEPVFSRIT